MRRRPVLTRALGVALALGACNGGGESGADGGTDGGQSSACAVPDGRSYFMRSLVLGGPEIGFDLTGDGEIDNEFGKLSDAARAGISAVMQNSIDNGETMVLVHVSDWGEPPVPDAADITVHIFSGIDADVPPDPSNNASGEGMFFASLDNFDLDCNSRHPSDEAMIADRVLSANRSVWSFALSAGGSVNFISTRMAATLEPDYGRAEGEIGFILDYCSLSSIPFPGEVQGSFLDALVNDPSLSVISADVDLDGDGLEQVIGDGVTFKECIDGDGTVIPGRTCPCHPAIADGISLGAYLSIVSAIIVDVR
jgi:hypothetical protein